MRQKLPAADIAKVMEVLKPLATPGLSQHSEQLYQLIDGDAPPPPILLEELLEAWSSSYVMHAQRVAHQKAMGLPVDEHEPATPEGMTMLGVSFKASPMKATGMPSNLRMV